MISESAQPMRSYSKVPADAKEAMMPVRKVKGGYRWGRKGKIYRGRGAKARALRQGRAIIASQRRRGRRR